MRITTLRATSGEILSYHLETAIVATRSLFGAFIVLDLQMYQDLSNIEWTRLIHVIINCFRLLSIALGRPTESSTAYQLGVITSYFERLGIRMQEGISGNDNAKDGPSMFLLFDSVLPLMKGKYEKMVSRLTASSGSYIAPSGPPNTLASLCPVYNGSIKKTDYWDAFTDTGTGKFNMTDETSVEDDFWINQLGDFGDFSPPMYQNNAGSYF
jgi:hypothetical protein